MELTLKNVQLSYPQVFEPKKFGDGSGGDKPKFSLSIVLDKKRHAKEIKLVREGIEKVRAAKPLNGVKLPPDKICLREGSERLNGKDEYPEGYSEDVMFINASNEKRPQVVDRDRSPLRAEDDKIYGGAIGNVVIRLWGQNNKFGKRVNASLEAVQYVSEGVRFGAPPVDVNAKFEDISGEDDDNP